MARFRGKYAAQHGFSLCEPLRTGERDGKVAAIVLGGTGRTGDTAEVFERELQRRQRQRAQTGHPEQRRRARKTRCRLRLLQGRLEASGPVMGAGGLQRGIMVHRHSSPRRQHFVPRTGAGYAASQNHSSSSP